MKSLDRILQEKIEMRLEEILKLCLEVFEGQKTSATHLFPVTLNYQAQLKFMEEHRVKSPNFDDVERLRRNMIVR